MRSEDRDDAGFTLVETMVGIVLVTIAIFALIAELNAYLHHQANERARTTAVRLMTTSLENARRLTPTQLAAIPIGTAVAAPTTEGGRSFTTTSTIQRCSATDLLTACTTPLSSSNLDTRVRITVTWNDGTRNRSVSTYASVADDSAGTYTPTGTGSLATLVGGTPLTNGVSISNFTATPSTTTVNASGVPDSAIVLSLTTIGLGTTTTGIPVTWTDDAGSHQWTMTGGPSSWQATIPAASISKAITTGTATLTFAATVPGASQITTANVTVRPGVWFSNCSVSPSPILLTLLTRKTAGTETLSCTTSGLSATDSVTVAYVSGTSTVTKTLTSTNGTAWSLTLPAGSLMANTGLSESFTFTATRSSDSATATSSASALVA